MKIKDIFEEELRTAIERENQRKAEEKLFINEEIKKIEEYIKLVCINNRFWSRRTLALLFVEKERLLEKLRKADGYL
jgi:hypothetical protein